MECYRPINLPQKGYVPCGKCYACLYNKTSDWTLRLQKEYESTFNEGGDTLFVTLTYDENHLTLRTFEGRAYGVVVKRDIQTWLKRLRKRISPCKVRYFCCAEYGPRTLRPHYHVILFGYPYDLSRAKDDIVKTWSKGFVVVKKVKPTHFAYCAKYCSSYTLLPDYLRHKSVRPFLLCSRRPAIGYSYLSDDMVLYHRQTLISSVRHDGIRRRMPKYYKDKIFDDDMKAIIRDRANGFRSKVYQETNHGTLEFTRLYLSQIADFERNFKEKLLKNKQI